MKKQSEAGARAAIILAAGKNTRFDTGIPKSLQRVSNETLLERQIRQYHEIGVHQIAVVAGYRGDQIVQAVERWNLHLPHPVSIVWNHQYERANAYSIIAARDWVKTIFRRFARSNPGAKPYFLCTMADHLFSDDFFSEITARFESLRLAEVKTSSNETGTSAECTLYLAVDLPGAHNTHIDIEDVTKVHVEGVEIPAARQIEGHRECKDSLDSEADAQASNLPIDETPVTGRLIRHIGKDLSHYSHYDTGCFLLFDEIFDAIDKAISLKGDSISDTVAWLAARHQAGVIDITGRLWSDIDTPQDYALSVHLHR
jgi:choline kinase